MTKKPVTKKPVVITTEHRGVFFGYFEDDSQLPAKITLTNCRMCVSWSSTIKGVLGLAATGPNSECRIGPAVPQADVWKITGVFDCTPEAAAAWEASPWKQ